MLIEILENVDIAKREMIPLCQDTGTTVVMVEIGQDAHIVGGSLRDAINKGVSKGYTEGFLRASMVAHPFSSRVNTKDNTPAVIHTEIVPGDKLEHHRRAQGRRLREHEPVADHAAVARQGRHHRVRPPHDRGVRRQPVPAARRRRRRRRLGGVLRCCSRRRRSRAPSAKPSDDPETAEFERELLAKVNALGVGPQAVGGVNTALAVNIETYPTHITSLPVAVNLQCHSARSKRATL